MKYKALQNVIVFQKDQVFEIKGDEVIVKVKPAEQPTLFEAVKEPTLGERARAAREKAKLTQKELGASFGVSAGYIASIEKADDAYFRRNASMNYLDKLETLGLSL